MQDVNKENLGAGVGGMAHRFLYTFSVKVKLI